MILRVAFVCMFWVGAVGAAPKADPLTTASDLIAEAEFDKALAVLDGALKSAKQPAEIAKIQLLRGQALIALNRADAAVTAFSAAIVAVPESDLDPALANPDAINALAKARRTVTSELSITMGAGLKASIRLDDSDMGPAPLKLKVGGGKHRIEATFSSGEKVVKDVDIVPGKPYALTIDQPLVASSLPPPPPPPTPAAEPGTTPPPAPPASVARPAPKKSSGGGSKLGLIPLGVGVAALGGGIACVVMAQGNHAQLTTGSQKIDLATENKLVSEGKLFQPLGWLGVGIGAAAAVAGTAMLLFMGGSGSGGGDFSDGVHFTASPTPTGGYVGLSGALP